MMRRDVFQAIPDPTRREIISLIAHKNMSATDMVSQFDVSRQAISKHIKILTECGLIKMRKQGREQICEARLDKLKEVNTWVKQYQKFWDRKLDALEIYLDKLQTNKNNAGKL